MTISCKEDPTSPNPSFSLTGDFDTKIFKSMLSNQPADKNVVNSPISISAVVKMIMAGAEGETKQEIIDAFDSKLSEQELLDNTKAFMDWLEARTGQPIIELSNAFFYDEPNYTPLKGYEEDLVNYFKATEFGEDFSNQEKALASLNGWVNEKTKTRIPKVLDEIASDEIMFLVNTLYLKADWKDGFVEDYTQKADFTLLDGSTTQVDMMYADRAFNVYQGQELQALELPYKDEEISMYFLKPTSGDVNDLIDNLDFEGFMKIKDGMTPSRYMAYLPKFKVEFKSEKVAGDLHQIGINRAFSNGAQLAKMGVPGNLKISRVVHKIYLTIDEKGTEGAAVTVGVVSVRSLPPTIKFDSPFAIVLADKAGDNILFMGRICDPSK